MRKFGPLLTLAISWIILLVAASCTTTGSNETGFAFTPVSEKPEGLGRAPDFQISVYQGLGLPVGADVQFSELLGKQPIVLNFWAGLCPPCRAEMPDLQSMYDANRDEVLLFGLDVGPFVGLGSREEGKRLLEELKVTFPTGTTLNAQVVRGYELIGMPTTYFIRTDGTIHRQWTGLLNRKKLDELVKELITASKRPEG